MLLRSEVNQAVLDLIKNSNTPSKVNHPVLSVGNLYPICKDQFTPRARLYLETRSYSLIYQYNITLDPRGHLVNLLQKLIPQKRAFFEDISVKYKIDWVSEFDIVQFIGSRCTSDNIEAAISKIVNTVNHLADKGFMKASLLPLSVVGFAHLDPTKPKEYAVVSYITLTKEGIEYSKVFSPTMFMGEGETPNRVEDQWFLGESQEVKNDIREE